MRRSFGETLRLCPHGQHWSKRFQGTKSTGNFQGDGTNKTAKEGWPTAQTLEKNDASNVEQEALKAIEKLPDDADYNAIMYRQVLSETHQGMKDIKEG